MRTILTLVASAAIATALGTGGAYACGPKESCTPTTIFTIFGNSHPGVPNPTRNGQFIGHFDANGVPQSTVSQSDSYVVTTVEPCPDEEMEM